MAGRINFVPETGHPINLGHTGFTYNAVEFASTPQGNLSHGHAGSIQGFDTQTDYLDFENFLSGGGSFTYGKGGSISFSNNQIGILNAHSLVLGGPNENVFMDSGQNDVVLVPVGHNALDIFYLQSSGGAASPSADGSADGSLTITATLVGILQGPSIISDFSADNIFQPP